MNKSIINIDAILAQNKSSRLFEGGFGFEKENVRVTLDGYLAQTPHPEILGSKSSHPYITTDFSESQIEIITPVRHNIKEALGFLETLHDEVSLHLDNELLWPQSAPPILPKSEDDIPIAKFDEASSDLEVYRTYLAENYGRRKQLLSGVHFNVSFDESYLKYMYENTVNVDFTYAEFREQVYLKTLRNFERYRWFLIALLSNSPAVHNSYVYECIKKLPALNSDSYHLPHAVSMRNSICGYRNKQNLLLNYDTIAGYNASIQQEIDKGIVSNTKENYSSIRMKSATEDDNITHLEVRILDLNPFVKLGVDERDAKIIHQFLVYCLLKPEGNRLDERVLERAFSNHDKAASFGLSKDIYIINNLGEEQIVDVAMKNLFTDIQIVTKDILPDDYIGSADYLKTLVFNITERPAYKMIQQLKDTSFIDWNLSKAKKYLNESKLKGYNFFGLEDMELSTQLLMREAIFRGVEVEVMDKSENFIKLSNSKKNEYVKQATCTSLDNYSSVLLMENKVMTKKLLRSAGISVPDGSEYDDSQRAFDDYMFYEKQAIVIKPKSTNFGLGITILKNNDDISVFKRAVDMAFEYDKTILIESFVRGKEYRFFVLNDELVGILHRVPANVTGDGVSSIKQLVDIKNSSDLRGKGYKTPLEKIAMGEPELMFLTSQGFNFNTVPESGKVIYLRENSNISTGGDSIDFTDDIHPSYKKIAVKAAQALNVKITGLDMMINDVSQEANATNYSIIEMNFNPAIHIHCYPFKGNNRQLNIKLLNALMFDK